MNSRAGARRDSSRFSSSLMMVITVALAFSLSGCDKLRARDALNKGVASYKAGQFDTAIEFFKKAEQWDPNLLNARIYLATAYASQYIPGAPSKENVEKGQQAIAEFQKVLEADPKNLSAIDGIGSMLYNMAGSPYDPKRFEESKNYHQKHIDIKPDDPEPYYWIGVIDWTLTFRANSEIRSDYNHASPKKQLKDDQPLPPKERAAYREKYSALVDEGLNLLKKAVELRPDYEDAMAYEGLLLLRKADMVDDMRERDALWKEDDQIVQKVKEIKQHKMENPPKQ
jgi:tetratricopeptide (TPR) repeat protein